MSKTTGNVIDPLDIIAEYGTDALRYTLVTGRYSTIALFVAVFPACLFSFLSSTAPTPYATPSFQCSNSFCQLQLLSVFFRALQFLY